MFFLEDSYWVIFKIQLLKPALALASGNDRSKKKLKKE